MVETDLVFCQQLIYYFASHLLRFDVFLVPSKQECYLEMQEQFRNGTWYKSRLYPTDVQEDGTEWESQNWRPDSWRNVYTFRVTAPATWGRAKYVSVYGLWWGKFGHTHHVSPGKTIGGCNISTAVHLPVIESVSAFLYVITRVLTSVVPCTCNTCDFVWHGIEDSTRHFW